MVATIKDGSHEAMILLNEFDECIFKLRGCRLRDTQKIAIIYAVMSDSNLLAQVNTGEGKSYIVSAIAIIRVKTKAYKFVDVITASSVLAQRDVDEMRDIYSAMQVSVGHNCDEQMENRMTMYKAEVVYGEIGLFQKDYLLHHFYRKNIFGERDRSSSCAIVDEVDNMLLDNGNNMLYLSHNVAGLEMLEPLFIHIQRLIYEVNRMESAPPTETIETMILTDLMGRLTKDDIAHLAVSKQTKSNTTSVWSSLVNANVIDSNGYFLIDNDPELERRKTEIAEVLYTSTKKGHAERILVCLKAVVNRTREIEVPRYLVPFCRQHLTEYIDNAKRARSMKHKEAYVVDNDTKRDQPLQVTIVDHNTGVDMSTSQWCDGLHQAVQIKHGCRVNPVSMKAVFVSNVNYLKGYARINGLSGTLGSEEESKTLVELYDAHLIKIPPSKAKKFYERVPVITQSYDEWINALFTAIKDQTNAKRSLLVICQSISAVDDIERGLLKRYDSLSTDEKRTMDCLENRIVYRREHEAFPFDSGEELDSGRLILATNLAGRGTNIKLSEELKLAGGLHVILSFLPANARIEEQAYGRAARCGECGSGQIIALTDQTIASGKPLTIFDMKSFRDTTETQRLKALTDHYNYQTKIEEDCLMEFKEHYLAAFTSMSNDKKRKNDVATENEIIYFAFLDEWALWLDSQASIIKQCAQNLSDSKRLEIIKSVKKFLELHPIEPEQALKWIKRPQPLLALGISKLDEQSFDDAKRIFTKIIDDFPEFGGDASYYLGIIAQKKVRKFRRVKTTDYEPLQNVQYVLHETVKRAVDYLPDSKCEMDDDKRIETEDCLIRAIHGFRCRIERKQESYRTVSVLQQLLGPNDPKSEGFKLQTEDVANVYNSLCTSAYDMMGHPISPATFSGNENVIDMNLQAQKTFSKCRHEGYVTEKAVNHNIANEQCEILRKKYTLSRPKVLRTFKAMIDDNRDNTTETYKRTYLNERVIRQQLYLPNREDFWEYLARNSCFTKLQKYYILNTDGVEGDIAELINLQPISPPEPTELRIQLSDYDLQTCKLFDAGEVEKVFKKDKHRFAWLIEMEYLVKDASALINRERFDNIVFMKKLDDFNLEMAEWLEVPVKDATWIVNKLLQTQSLQTKLVNTTTFIYQTADFDFSTIPKCLKSSVNTFLIHKFAYTFAYNALRHSLDAAKKDPTTKNRILLPSKPHEILMKDLIYYGLVHDHKIELREKDILDKEMQKRLEEVENTHKPRLFIKSGQLKSTKTYFKDVNVDASYDIQDQAINHIRQVGKIEDNYAGIFWNILKIGKTLLKAYLSISCPVTFLLFVYDNYDECMECLHLALSIGAAVGTLLYYQQLAKAKCVLHQRGRSEEQQFSRLLKLHSRNVQTGQKGLKQCKLAEIIASSITSKITKPFNDPSHFRNYSSFKTLESKLSSLLMSSGMTPKHFKSMTHKFLEQPSRWQFLRDAVQDVLIPTMPVLCKHYYKIVQSCKSSCEFDLDKALSVCKTLNDNQRIQLTETDESFICSLLCKIVEDIIVLLEETTRNVASQEVQAAESYLTELQEDAGSDNSDSGSETENNDGQILKTNKQCLKAVNGFMIALFSRTKNIYQQEIKNNVCERLIPVFTKYANKPDEIPENAVVKNGLTMRNKVRQNDRLKYGSIQFETYQPKSFIINDFQEVVQQMYAKQPSDKLLAVMIQYGYAMKSNMVHALSSSLFLVLKRYMHNLQDVVPKVALEEECIIFHVIRYQCTSSLQLKLNNDCFYICKKDFQKVKTNGDISFCLFESFVKQFPELSEMDREGPSVFRENLLKHL